MGLNYHEDEKMQKLLIGIMLIFLCHSSLQASEFSPKDLVTFDKLHTITGKYASTDGNLELIYSEGILYFEVIIVNKKAHIGELEGEIILNNNTAIYHNVERDCSLSFQFYPKEIQISQKGHCDMGLNVTATDTYKSMSEKNVKLVIGQVGDSMDTLFYAKDLATYEKYCYWGVEEYATNILCKAREKSGKDSPSILHIFEGKDHTIYGILPPLSIAKKFKIIVTK